MAGTDNSYNDYLAKVRGSESGGNQYAKNPRSTASGLYQFTERTWRGLGYDWKDRFNPTLQNEAMAKLTNSNSNYLKSRLGITPTDADLYGAHFLGPQGYASVYNKPDNTPLSSVLTPGAMSANPFLAGKTTGFLKDWLSKKMNVKVSPSEFSGDSYSYGVDTSLNLPMNTGEYQTAPEMSETTSKEDLEAEQAKAELLEKQREKEFLAEVQDRQDQDSERRYQQEQQVPQQEAELDPSYYQVPQIELPNYEAIKYQQAQNQAQIPQEQYKDGGSIPQRYKNMGFTHVGQKKAGDGQKKWKVLAKKGDKYKVVQGGYRGMKDFSQHHSKKRQDNFWSRMGGRDSAKANDPFSPLYWHKRLGKWEDGGEIEGKVECTNCGWSWDKSESTEKDMYNCHKCGGKSTGRSVMKNGGQTDDDREMVNGIADILSQVDNQQNRAEIAKQMVKDFKNQDVVFDYEKFMEMSKLQNGGELLSQFQQGGEKKWLGNTLDKNGYITSETKGGNRISFTGNQRADEWINKQIDSGKFGFDPKTKGTFPLKKPVKGLSKEDQFIGTKQYHDLQAPEGFTNESQQAQIDKLPEWQQDMLNAENTKRRKRVVYNSMQDAVKNPLFYAPGAIALAPIATAGLTEAGILASPYIESALATQLPGMATVPGATVGNAITAGFAGHGLAHIGPDSVEMYKNPSWQNAFNLAMDVAEVAPVAGPAAKTITPKTITPGLGEEIAAVNQTNGFNLARTTAKAKKNKLPQWTEVELDNGLIEQTPLRKGINDHVVKQVVVPGKGEISLKTASDTSGNPVYYFSANVADSGLSAGKAFKHLEQFIPKGSKILEQKSLSTDSFYNMMQRAKNPKKFTWVDEGQFLPLNNSGKNRLLSNNDKAFPGSTNVKFEDYNEAVKALNEFNSRITIEGMPKAKLSKIVDDFQPVENGPWIKKTTFGIDIPNIGLIKEYKKGGSISQFQQGGEKEVKSALGAGKFNTTTGDTVVWGTPEYEAAYNRGEVVTDKGGRSEVTLEGGQLDDVVIKNNYKRGFWEKYRDKIIDENKDASILGAIIGTPISAVTSLPQLAATYGITGKMERPSEAMDIKNPYLAMGVDALTDPADWIGVGELSTVGRLSKAEAMDALMMSPLTQKAGKVLGTEEGLLSNTYKYNPWAFKPNSEAYYRGIGRSGLDDALEKGILRPPVNTPYGKNRLYMTETFGETNMYNQDLPKYKGDPFGEANDDWIVILPKDSKRYVAEIPKNKTNFVIENDIGNTGSGYSTIFPKLSDVKLYKQDWLQGYKPIEVPKSSTSTIENYINNKKTQFQQGGNFDSNSARDMWVAKTGMSWGEAKSLGYTDGSRESNIELLDQLRDKNFKIKSNKKMDTENDNEFFPQVPINPIWDRKPPVTKKSVTAPVRKAKKDIKKVDPLKLLMDFATGNMGNNQNLQNGVITDKRSNTNYVVENGVVTRTFPVLTALNPDVNVNDKGVVYLDSHPESRGTPVGAYVMDPKDDIYGEPGFRINPIPAFGQPAPKAKDIALHVTYPGEFKQRNALYSQDANKRYASYGCVNCRKPDLKYLTDRFKKGDTTIVIDSKNRKDADFLGRKLFSRR